MRRVADDGRQESETASTANRLVPLRILAGLAVLGWAFVLVIGLAWLILILGLDWGYCGRGDSTYGELSWSLLPPGPTCTWTKEADGFDAHQGPTAVMSLWLLSLLAGGLVARLLVRTAQFGHRTITYALRAATVASAIVGLIALVGASVFGSLPLLGLAAGLFVTSFIAWQLSKKKGKGRLA
jgi:hypothetical protein